MSLIKAEIICCLRLLMFFHLNVAPKQVMSCVGVETLWYFFNDKIDGHSLKHFDNVFLLVMSKILLIIICHHKYACTKLSGLSHNNPNIIYVSTLSIWGMNKIAWYFKIEPTFQLSLNRQQTKVYYIPIWRAANDSSIGHKLNDGITYISY